MSESTLGRRLAAALAASGLTKTHIQRKLGVPYSTVDNWEADKSIPQDKNLDRVAAIVGVAPKDLRYGAAGRTSQGMQGDPPYPAWAAFTETGLYGELEDWAREEIRRIRSASARSAARSTGRPWSARRS